MQPGPRAEAERAAERKSQVSTGIKCQNPNVQFPQGRVTDHRIGLTLHALRPPFGRRLDSRH